MNDKARVVVVDDHVELAESLAAVLRARGYDVRAVADGIEALAEVEAFGAECVLLDLSMPRMGGAELAQRLRERHGNQIVLVVVSGRGNLHVGSEELAAVDHWLEKPIDFEVLYRIFPKLDTAG